MHSICLDDSDYNKNHVMIADRHFNSFCQKLILFFTVKQSLRLGSDDACHLIPLVTKRIVIICSTMDAKCALKLLVPILRGAKQTFL